MALLEAIALQRAGYERLICHRLIPSECLPCSAVVVECDRREESVRRAIHSCSAQLAINIVLLAAKNEMVREVNAIQPLLVPHGQSRDILIDPTSRREGQEKEPGIFQSLPQACRVTRPNQSLIRQLSRRNAFKAVAHRRPFRPECRYPGGKQIDLFELYLNCGELRFAPGSQSHPIGDGLHIKSGDCGVNHRCNQGHLLARGPAFQQTAHVVNQGQFAQCLFRLAEQQITLSALCEGLRHVPNDNKIWNRHCERLLIIAVHPRVGAFERLANHLEVGLELVGPGQVIGRGLNLLKIQRDSERIVSGRLDSEPPAIGVKIPRRRRCNGVARKQLGHVVRARRFVGEQKNVHRFDLIQRSGDKGEISSTDRAWSNDVVNQLLCLCSRSRIIESQGRPGLVGIEVGIGWDNGQFRYDHRTGVRFLSRRLRPVWPGIQVSRQFIAASRHEPFLHFRRLEYVLLVRHRRRNVSVPIEHCALGFERALATFPDPFPAPVFLGVEHGD